MAVTRDDVEKLSSTGWSQLSDTKKDELLNVASNQADTIYSGDVATLPTIQGDRDDFVQFLAAHFFELAGGGEAQSEGAGGGSVTYNTASAQSYQGLTQTRYGRTAQQYLRDESGIGIVRTH